MVALLTGLVAGIAHVLSGPDHWVAVAPLSVANNQCAQIWFSLGCWPRRWRDRDGGGDFLKDVFSLTQCRPSQRFWLVLSWSRRACGLFGVPDSW